MNALPPPAAPPAGFRHVIQVALPLVISMGSHTLMQFCDRIFLAWHSPVALQAALPAGILAFTLICGFMELANYGGTFVAQFHGAGRTRDSARAAGQAVWLAFLGWPVILALMPLGAWLLRLGGHAPEVLAHELDYFQILAAGSLTVLLPAALGAFFTGRGDTLTTMSANLAGNLVNVVLDYLLIFGRAGCPAMGIRGAAIATVLAGGVTTAILLGCFLRADAGRYAPRRAFAWNGALLRRMLRFGTPSALTMVMDIGSFALFVLLIGRMGPAVLTASNLALSVNHLAFMPLLGLSITAATLTGQFQGAARPDLATRATLTTLKTGAVYMVLLAITFATLPHLYFAAFNRWEAGALDNAAVFGLVRTFLTMMAVWGLFNLVNLVLAGALRGAGDTRFVMLYSLAMAWGVWVPGQLLLVFHWQAEAVILWVWLTVYVLLLAVGYAWRFARGRWRTIRLIEHPPEPPVVQTADPFVTG